MSDTPSEDFAHPEPEGENKPSYPGLEELAALLPQYEMVQLIGAGGMGAVYLARQPHLDREVALKVLPASVSENAEDAVRFNNEARAMARLSHPNIVAVFNFGQTEAGHLYLAMEYVEGVDLHWRTRAGEVTPDRARSVIVQLCDALQYAHEHGVIHRDIKPANILITPDWQVKVIDFGLARDTRAEAHVDEEEYGTPDYTAPERFIAGAVVDHRADIYSLGVVIHEILTGLTPRAAGAAAGKWLPDGFAGVLSKCLMQDPARRFQSAAEARAALLAAAAEVARKKEAEEAAAAAAAQASAGGPRYQPPGPVSSQGRAGGFGNLGWAVACVVALAALGWMVWNDHYRHPGEEEKSLAAMPDKGADSTARPAPVPATVPAPAPASPVATAPAMPPTATAENVPAAVTAAPPNLPAGGMSMTGNPTPEAPPAMDGTVIVRPASAMQTPGMMGEDSSAMGANNPAPSAVNSESPPTMNKAIPTALALAASTATAFSVDYQSQIVPIFRNKCYECHSEEKGKEKGKVSLDTEAKLKAAIGPGQHIIPGEPEKSTMLQVCKLPNDDEDVMPPKGKNRLTPAEVTLLETWIKEGANLAGGGAPVAAMPATAAPTAWTSSDGKTITATFVSLAGDQITLKMADNKEYVFPLSRLSAESQAQAKTAAGQ